LAGHDSGVGDGEGDTSAAFAPRPPLGARLRPPVGGYSVSLGLMEEVSRGLREIPPLPQALFRITKELDAGGSSAASVAAILGREPVLAASLLRIANSAAFGLNREIVTVSEGVAYLGFAATKALIMRLQVGSIFPPASGGGYDPEKLWAHSIAAAQAAEELARRAGGADPHLALTAGLLHDIGKIALNSQFPGAARRLWETSADPDESILAREQRVFGADHAAIGAELASNWKLPAELVEMIRLHHLPGGQPMTLSSEARRALLCVFVANQLVKYHHVYCDGMEIDQIPPQVTAELGLPPQMEGLVDDGMRQTIVRAVTLTAGANSGSPRAAA